MNVYVTFVIPAGVGEGVFAREKTGKDCKTIITTHANSWLVLAATANLDDPSNPDPALQGRHEGQNREENVRRGRKKVGRERSSR